MLAADVLISDYSSITFDYANLDRPIVLLVDDLGVREQPAARTSTSPSSRPGWWRGPRRSCSPHCRPARSPHAEAAKHRHLFREKFCEFDDGRAAERVVRRVFLGETDVPRDHSAGRAVTGTVAAPLSRA